MRNPEVRIETCTYCNAHCTICPREKLTRGLCVMPEGHFYYLVNQAKELGAEIISPYGYGEPLIDPGIALKVDYVTRVGLSSFLTTNASLLTEEMSRILLDAGLSKIRFSVHGVEANYEKVHRKLKWKTVFNNIINFLAINDVDYDRQCTVSMSCIPMNNECIYYFRYLWENKVDELEIWKPHNWTDGKGFREVKKRKTTCGRPFNGPIQINADGKMMVCCFDYNGKMIVGDTYKSTIKDILTGQVFNAIRHAHKTGDLRGLPCETCDQLNIEESSPLLYSNVDSSCETGKTSTIKFKMEI